VPVGFDIYKIQFISIQLNFWKCGHRSFARIVESYTFIRLIWNRSDMSFL